MPTKNDNTKSIKDLDDIMNGVEQELKNLRQEIKLIQDMVEYKKLIDNDKE